jgi:hypothetical protein
VLQLEAEGLIRSEIGKITTVNLQVAAERMGSHPHGGWLVLRFSLSYRDAEELLVERDLDTDHVTVWRWVQVYAPELNKRCRSHVKLANKSYRIDETYIKVKGEDKYLY